MQERRPIPTIQPGHRPSVPQSITDDLIQSLTMDQTEAMRVLLAWWSAPARTTVYPERCPDASYRWDLYVSVLQQLRAAAVTLRAGSIDLDAAVQRPEDAVVQIPGKLDGPLLEAVERHRASVGVPFVLWVRWLADDCLCFVDADTVTVWDANGPAVTDPRITASWPACTVLRHHGPDRAGSLTGPAARARPPDAADVLAVRGPLVRFHGPGTRARRGPARRQITVALNAYFRPEP